MFESIRQVHPPHLVEKNIDRAEKRDDIVAQPAQHALRLGRTRGGGLCGSAAGGLHRLPVGECYHLGRAGGAAPLFE